MKDIVTKVEQHVAVITISRPHRRNSMTLAMWEAMPAIIAGVEADSAVRAIVLRGEGGHFCSGADIAEFEQVRSTGAEAERYGRAVDGCCDAVFDAKKPTLAVVDGFCLGGGCHLAMSCDFRLGTGTAVFGIPAARLGIVYDVSGTSKLLALVGVSKAKQILYGGQRFDAAEALRIGLLDGLDDDAMTRALEMAGTLSQNAPLSIAGAKRILNALSITGGVDPAEAREVIARAIHSADYREGRTAFTEKRPPRFRGI